MITFIDSFLNKTTMYRLVLYYLVVLIVAAAFLGFFGVLPYSPSDIAFSTLLILGVSWVANTAFAKAFGAAANVESVYITGLILALIISPVASTDYAGVGFLVFASVWAMASKYVLAIGKKHIFNPAAFGVALSALVIGKSATWWGGSSIALLPLVFLGGVLIVRKLRRADLVLAFMATALLAVLLTTPGFGLLPPITQTFLYSPFFFFAFVMLTEPLTMPPDRWRRVAYGVLVGIFFAPNVHIGSLYLTPEMALLVGNVFVYLVSPKGRFMLELVGKKELGRDVYEYVFAPDRPFSFLPGQYLEWTLPHKHSDNRGNRRYFTIASAPGEDTVNLGVKFYEPKSSFKRELYAMEARGRVSVSHLAGDFTLPKNPHKKVAFIAGGIGITPFRSMIQHLVGTGDRRSAVLLYANRSLEDVAYKDVFDHAEREIGLKTVYAFSRETNLPPGAHAGKIDAELIARAVPDYAERLFYISGPNAMVEAAKKTLSAMGVSRWNIKTDYFPGFA